MAAPPAPEEGACYRLRLTDLTKPTSNSPPVSCRKQHTTRTIFVGRLDTVVDGHAIAVDSDAAQEQVARTCPAKLASYLGGTRSKRHLSRFSVGWFSPTLDEADQGAHWFRCDLIAFAGEQSLLSLPTRSSLRSVLSHPVALNTYGLCGTAAPGHQHFERVICSRRHSWRATSTIAIPGGARYPGTAAARRAGDAICKHRARDARRFSLRFRYGWEWPTREQWHGGQHYGFCWVPDR